MVKFRKMKKDLVMIFDFDGTIADTINFLRTIFDFPGAEDVDWEGLKNKETREIFRSLGISLAEIPFMLNKVRSVLHKEIEKIKPIEGMKKTLSQVRKKSSCLGILTSCPQKTVEKFLQINNLNFFDFVCSEGDIFNKAKKLDNLLKKRKLDPQSVFYVGDETRDIEAAKTAGVRTVAVTWGLNGEKILRKRNPDYLIREPQELVALVDTF